MAERDPDVLRRRPEPGRPTPEVEDLRPPPSPGHGKRRGLLADAWRHMPRREQLLESRWLRPFAHRIAASELWRFTRRSVPRGVALGLFVGIFLLLPGVQAIGVALLALPLRANIPLGVLMTFVSIPPTTLFIFLPGAIWVSNGLFGLSADLATLNRLRADNAALSEWLGWLFSDVAVGLISGLFVIGTVSAALGYVLAVWLWRWRLVRKWRARRHR